MLLVLCFLFIYFFICFGDFYLLNFWGVLFCMFLFLFYVLMFIYNCILFRLSVVFGLVYHLIYNFPFCLLLFWPLQAYSFFMLLFFHVVLVWFGLVWFHFVSFCAFVFHVFLVIAHFTIISIAMNFPHSWHRECRGEMCWLYSVSSSSSSSSSSLMHILFFNFSYIWMLKWSSYVLLYSTLITEILDSDWAIAPMWCQINIIMVLSSLCSLSFHKYKISISCLFVYMQRHIISNIKYI